MISATPDQRRLSFEALVLQALWILILRLAPGGSRPVGWRADAIAYLDEHGNQSDGAREHRRHETFPEIRR